MVIAFKLPKNLSEAGRGIPSLEGIQDVWRFLLILGLASVLFSWIRGSHSKN
jgi:hypothetical protein